MDETYYAGVYWGPRKESPEECARRAEAFMSAISAVDPAFSRWFQQGKSRKDALKRPIEPGREVLEKLIRKGRDRQFEQLGYTVWAWNGVCDDYDDSGFNFNCSSYAENLTNRCVFSLPSRGPNAERVLSAAVLTGLVRSMANSWEPDWGVAMSHKHRDMVSSRAANDARRVAWVTYFARHLGTVPPLPAPVRIEPVEDKGTLIILTPERFTADNPDHLELAERVRELLGRAGLLGSS
jgi:hypothetical protein